MASKKDFWQQIFPFISILIIKHLINIKNVCAETNINEIANLRCEQICSDDKQQLFKTDCERGCRYFNIGFLTSVRNVNKVTDLNTTQNECKVSCNDAYIEIKRRDACHFGCMKMYDLQIRAPKFIHGWLVYMGTSSDLESPTDDDWLLLDTLFHPKEYDSLDNKVPGIRSYVPETNRHFSGEFCVPIWMWLFPILVIIVFIWLQYGNIIRNILALDEECDDDDQDKKEDFIVSMDAYYYPSPAVPPPKYTEIDESSFLNSDDDFDIVDSKYLLNDKLKK